MEEDNIESSSKKEVECKPNEAYTTTNTLEVPSQQNRSSCSDVFADEESGGNELVLNKTLVIDTNLNIKLPRMNVPEKIIICLDLCADNDNDSTPFR